MNKRVEIWVQPCGPGRWTVVLLDEQAEERHRELGWRRTKREALALARSCRLNYPLVELVICGRNGQIQDPRTYPKSSDPRKSKG